MNVVTLLVAPPKAGGISGPLRGLASSKTDAAILRVLTPAIPKTFFEADDKGYGNADADADAVARTAKDHIRIQPDGGNPGAEVQEAECTTSSRLTNGRSQHDDSNLPPGGV
ncbi:hypothetical protein [Sabulicella rubraurantiaca]|uniref:hypothetical protein n=1 Tax=Sabulicella rubraurantiaca TaxID=2811429 RepID=UPI001A96811B|nr:hypothetical protein [Sabulicella rubraurantiaca]